MCKILIKKKIHNHVILDSLDTPLAKTRECGNVSAAGVTE